LVGATCSRRIRTDSPIHHHLPLWWDVGAVAAFSLAVYYYAIHGRLGPERVVSNVLEAVSDAHQEDLDLGLAEHV
jgi:hypothetical protein